MHAVGGIAGYLAKEVSKAARAGGGDGGDGKWWGVWGRDWLDKCVVEGDWVPLAADDLEAAKGSVVDAVADGERADLGIGHIGPRVRLPSCFCPRVLLGERALWLLWAAGAAPSAAVWAWPPARAGP